MNHIAFSLNETVSKFRSKNPAFDGGISLVGTSFAALFLFDLLQVQKSSPEFWKLNFSTINFYALGLPATLLATKTSHSNFEPGFCRKFKNIIQKSDPLAERVEPLLRPELSRTPIESIENEGDDRIDYSVDADFDGNYFSSEALVLRIVKDIYNKKLDSNGF